VNSVANQSEPSPDDVKILLAEDEVLVRLMLADALRGQGFQVFEAANADDAIVILRSMRVDVVATDLHMRVKGDGVLLAKYVREHCSSTPVLLASGHAPTSEGVLFDAFFVKPYRPEDIANWIKRRGRTPDTAEALS
jgi:CheY-like chemotaxis protein